MTLSEPVVYLSLFVFLPAFAALVLVGDGEMREEIEALIHRHQLQKRIQITGWASEAVVRAHLAQARALVLPSFAEGLPVVIMEALAMGRPVLSTYVAGIPELVEPEKCGWLVPAGSVDALAVTMKDVLRALPERLEHMGREGRRRVLEAHDVRKNAQMLKTLFDRYAEDSASPIQSSRSDSRSDGAPRASAPA
jgi:colanic acid/amylovoran biosynthesis glycosyltransferase